MIVIAPRNMHLDIINYYRKDNPFFDVKVVDKNDLVGAAGYLVKQDTILYMMLHYGYSYDEAQTYLSFLKTEFVPSSPKLNKLKALQEELIEANYLYKSEVSRLIFEHKSALVIGYSELDNELLHLSNSLDMKLDFFKYDDSYNVNSINYFYIINIIKYY